MDRGCNTPYSCKVWCCKKLCARRNKKRQICILIGAAVRVAGSDEQCIWPNYMLFLSFLFLLQKYLFNSKLCMNIYHYILYPCIFCFTFLCTFWCVFFGGVRGAPLEHVNSPSTSACMMPGCLEGLLLCENQRLCFLFSGREKPNASRVSGGQYFYHSVTLTVPRLQSWIPAVPPWAKR